MKIIIDPDIEKLVQETVEVADMILRKSLCVV